MMYKVLFLAFVFAFVACSSDSGESSNPAEPGAYQGGNAEYDYWLNKGIVRETLKPCNVGGVDNCEYGTLEDARDGQVYKTVKIGNHVWMAENLNFASEKSFCVKADNCKGYGRLYSRAIIFDTLSGPCKTHAECDAVMPVQGVCPDGWHVSTGSDWDDLYQSIGNSVAGFLIAKEGAWPSSTENYRDAFGLGLIPTPSMEGDGMLNVFNYAMYDEYGIYGFEGDANGFTNVYSYHPGGLSVYGSGYDYTIALGVGVRCVQNEKGAVGTVSHMTPVVEKKKLSDFLNPNIPYGEFVDERDGQTYKTVVIGKQTWMAQNLNFNTGDTLSKCFDNSEEFCDKFGRLYYKEAAQRADICPTGWHVPSSTEMQELLKVTSCLDTVAHEYKYEPLMAVGAWSFHVYPANESRVKDEFGFSLMPSVNLYTMALLWEKDGYSLIVREHSYDIDTSDKRGSIRCLQDEAVTPVNVVEIEPAAD